MARPIVAKKVHHYTTEFKIQAVRLALHPDIQTQDVAHALDIHPFMLSRWKKEYRDGRLKPNGAPQLPGTLRVRSSGKLGRRGPAQSPEDKVALQLKLRELEQRYEALRIEHDLLKKAIRFNIKHRRRSSSS